MWDANGSSDFMTIAGLADPNTGAQTWAAWVYPQALNDGDGEHVIFHQLDGTGTGRTILSITKPSTIWRLSSFVGGSGSTGGTGDTEFAINTWYFVAVTWASGGATNIKVFTNGVEEDSNADNPEACNGDNIIGKHKIGTRFFDGYINDVYHWNTDLTAVELLSIYNSKVKGFGLQVQSSSLDLYLPFDDYATGTVTNGNTWSDRSGDGNDWTSDGTNGGVAVAETLLSYPAYA